MLDDLQQKRFTRLWTDAQPAVAGYVHAIVRDPAAAKDLVQETALVLLRKFSEYDERRPFLPWALGVAKFQILGYRRDAARCLVTFDAELFEQFTESWGEVAPTISDQAAALQTCLDKLAQHARRVVQLRYFEALDSTQIAERLGSSAGAVRVLLQRVREQLRLCVERQLRMEGGAL
ncbi:MAG: sigma-70 family RNA polymerase sigma factor [Acidovorax sp.]|nr:sigma-70 family RNA polymerase sigma factor [Acidovorax sp.]